MKGGRGSPEEEEKTKEKRAFGSTDQSVWWEPGEEALGRDLEAHP